jgi:hypothetical protein
VHELAIIFHIVFDIVQTLREHFPAKFWKFLYLHLQALQKGFYPADESLGSCPAGTAGSRIGGNNIPEVKKNATISLVPRIKQPICQNGIVFYLLTTWGKRGQVSSFKRTMSKKRQGRNGDNRIMVRMKPAFVSAKALPYRWVVVVRRYWVSVLDHRP